MNQATLLAKAAAPLTTMPSASRFLLFEMLSASETEAPPVPPQTEPDTKPKEPPPSTEPETEPDHITPTQPVEEPSPDDLPDRTHTTCPVYPRKS